MMSLILLYTGINKGKLFLLRSADFYCENEDSWIKVPGTNRSVPVADILHLLVLRYSEKNLIDIERLLFLNRDKKYTARSFEEAITKQCLKSGILDGEYVFKVYRSRVLEVSFLYNFMKYDCRESQLLL